jgi:hypothetical protein
MTSKIIYIPVDERTFIEITKMNNYIMERIHLGKNEEVKLCSGTLEVGR